jgi:hypothetical protein
MEHAENTLNRILFILKLTATPHGQLGATTEDPLEDQLVEDKGADLALGR